MLPTKKMSIHKNSPAIVSVCKATPDKYSCVFVKLILAQKLIYPGIISFKTRGNKGRMNANSRHTNEPSLRGETNTIQTRLAARCCTENRFGSTTHNNSVSYRSKQLLFIIFFYRCFLMNMEEYFISCGNFDSRVVHQ